MDTFEHDNKMENDIIKKSVNVWDWKVQIHTKIFNLNSAVFNRISSLQDAEPNTASLNNFTYTSNGREKFCNNIYLKGLDTNSQAIYNLLGICISFFFKYYRSGAKL